MHPFSSISSFVSGLMPYMVLVNFILICALVKKARKFEQAFKMHKEREQNKLEKDTMEALRLLKSGKTEEARSIAERIINA